jgi:hypothetical protein
MYGFGSAVFRLVRVSLVLRFIHAVGDSLKGDTMDAKLRWANARDLRTAEIHVRASLGARERAWIVGRLMSQRGVEDVSFSDVNAPSLLVEYDPDLVTGAELVSSLYRCGLPAPVRGDR